jgi:hypothetical protein
LINEGSIFGFNSTLSAPLNTKLEEITEKGLSEAIKKISDIDKSMLYYIEATHSEGRQMYAKSPYRKQNVKKRIS